MGWVRVSVVFGSLFLVFSPQTRAQVVDVQVQPNPASEFEPVEVFTSFPLFLSSQTFDIQVSIDDAVVTIDVLVTGQPAGAPSFLLDVETIGPLAPGDYEIVANYRVDGVLEDSATTSLLVVPVRAVSVLQTPLTLILLVLLLTSYAFRTRFTRI